MAAPAGTRSNRWNQVVSAVASDMGWTTVAADAWLNVLWTQRRTDETAGDLLAHDRLVKWLEANDTTSPTLALAFEGFVT